MKTIDKLSPTDVARFWTQVSMASPSGCWVWFGNIGSHGYGRFSAHGTMFLAHRVAWSLIHGREPDGLILHHCDNPPCVNPDHLYLGDNLANTQDCIRRGRFRPGVNRGRVNGVAKLTEDQVREIRALRRTGLSLEAIAERFPVNAASVGNVVAGRCWAHVPDVKEAS